LRRPARRADASARLGGIDIGRYHTLTHSLTLKRTPMPIVQLPSLTALKAFEAVGRLGSVRAAGDELAVSHTVISRHLRHLQESLDIALMVPRGRALVLTDEGRSYHQEVCKAFAILKRATSLARVLRPAHLVHARHRQPPAAVASPETHSCPAKLGRQSAAHARPAQFIGRRG
jgi:molybdenum-dependent DNA-binding transcriptional regulator ModE